ncbi:Hydroxyacid-oxoacid transhydrogenase, mitochondrial [Bulinus truncatus]|nr:Hydroxyacid-oxoacid transhydrogenase, mitochondrial [Bulinus truncatus]
MASQKKVLRSCWHALSRGHLKRKCLESKEAISFTCLRSISSSQVHQAKEFAFEMACSNIRYGEGVTKEVGMDCINLGGKNVCVMTDPNFGQTAPRLPVKHPVKPLIAITTTAGTGSETTGTSVFDLKKMQAKTGISSRSLRPTLGILDPLHLLTMPERVAAYSGIDVLCHAIESYTAMPYYERQGQDDPSLRPAYQGNNPISDIWSLEALASYSQIFKKGCIHCR